MILVVMIVIFILIIIYLLIKLIRLSMLHPIDKKEVELLIKQIPTAVAIVDTHLNFIYVSDQWLLDYNLKNNNIIGKYIFDILPDIPDSWRSLYAYCLQGHVQVRNEEPYIKNDYSLAYLNFRIQPWYNHNNIIAGLIISSQIVTEHVKARESIIINEKRLNQAVNGTSDGLWDWNIQTNFMYYTARFLEILGFREEELGLTFDDFTSRIHADDIKKVLSCVNEHLYQHMPFDIECRILNIKDEYIWIRIRGLAAWDYYGNPMSLSGFITDITAKKQNEFALKLSEERFRLLVDNIKDYVIIMLDENGYVTTWNHGAENIIGYKASEIIGKSMSVFYTEDDISKKLPKIALETAKENGRFEEEGWKLKKNGTRFWSHVVMTPLYDHAGKLIGYGQVQRDLSLIKKNEHALLMMNERLQGIMNSSHLAIMVTDLKGKIVLFNHAAENMLGYSAMEILDKCTPLIFHDAEEISQATDKLSKKFNRSIKPGFDVLITNLEINKVNEHDWTYIRSDGTRFPVLLSVTPLRSMSGKAITGYLFIALDITERKALNQLKNEFISVVSHELRTPLTSVYGSMALLDKKIKYKLDKQEDELLNIAIKNTGRLIRLINDILDIEKMDSGKMIFNLNRYDVNKLVEEAVSLNQSFANTFSIKIKITKTLYNVFIHVDHDRFIQVLTNLIANAVKFSEKLMEVKIGISMHGTDVRIEVIDEGQGIPISFRDKIFDKFSQADASTKRDMQGTGLGLNIAKTIIENMNGKINFVSETGKGSTFYIDLPICK